MGTLPCFFFFCTFSKGDNVCGFLLASPEGQSLFKIGSTLKGKNLLPFGSKFFPLKVDPIEKKGKIEDGRVASLDIVPIHLKWQTV